jgi:hypothetical protein
MRLKKIKNQKFKILISLITIILSACNNVATSPNRSTSSTNTSNNSNNTTQSSINFDITNVTINPPPQNSNNNVATTVIAFNAISANGKNLLDFCMVQSSGNEDPTRACVCKFQWTEVNTSDSSTVTRTVTTDISQVSSFQISCPVPQVYASEIPDGTYINISVAPDTNKGNASGFTTSVYAYKKQTSPLNGDFRDVEGRTYKNIYHYVCYDKTAKPMSITRKTKTWSNQITGKSVQPQLANAFQTGLGSGQNPFSAQSYYYDFYIRSNDLGAINESNSQFTCPRVNVNGLPSFYPMDSTFALALNPSRDFPIQVNTYTQITGNTAAIGTIGYAAKPNADGTCPSFVDSNNQIRRTYRLRQYTTVYPLRYNADGTVLDSTQKVNTVYVLDRPINKAGQDPLKPMTRLGPKPCPFAFKTAQFGYKCMSDGSLTGKNIDGIELQGDKTCPIYPIPKDSNGNVLTDSTGTLVIRPYKAFVAHFIENTNFKACAFESSTPVDPPIVLEYDNTVFSPTSGPHYFYCTKNYPNAGNIIPPPTGDPFDKPPSECSQSDIATAIKTDKTYSCLKTYDPYNGTVSTPQNGCCQQCAGPNPLCKITAYPTTLQRGVPNQTNGCFDPYEP